MIDSEVEGGVESLFATPRGLVVSVGADEETKWYFSTDVHNWTEVPADQIPDLSNRWFQTDSVSVAGDDQRILMVGREVLESADGVNWSRGADRSQILQLAQGAIEAIAAADPRFVAVGIDNKAWYSTDGSDRTLAEVPSRPGEPSRLQRPLDPSETQGGVGMEGIALSGRNLLAWGKSIWVHDDGSATFVPVFWMSADGMTWKSAPAPTRDWGYPTVAGGPNGFLVANEGGGVWSSVDGSSWEQVALKAFGSPRRPTDALGQGNVMHVGAIAAASAGYVAAGQDGSCGLPCSTEEAVVWTSSDGRFWERFPTDDLFGGTSTSGRSGATTAAFWVDQFVVGGSYGDHPVIWISGSDQAGTGELLTWNLAAER